jgi:hypothetical protein
VTQQAEPQSKEGTEASGYSSLSKIHSVEKAMEHKIYDNENQEHVYRFGR